MVFRPWFDVQGVQLNTRLLRSRWFRVTPEDGRAPPGSRGGLSLAVGRGEWC